jgi:hypothetical protein
VTGSGHDQQAIASMRAIPAKQQYGVANVELPAWTYEGTKAAEEGLQDLKQPASRTGPASTQRGAAKEGT